MNASDTTFRSDQTLAELALASAGATRVFHRHGLDFCCNGRVTLEEACAAKSLGADALLEELQKECAQSPAAPDWGEQTLSQIIDHLLTRFHEPHREELPRLLSMARKVESVHGEKDACPKGLADHLERMLTELEEHMQKEEQVLFPMLRAGRGRMAFMPIQVMEEEHQEHGKNLERLAELAHGFVPPPEACGTWSALYLGLAQLQADLMEHIHLENHVLFPRAAQG